jgi:hypothetical protein
MHAGGEFISEQKHVFANIPAPTATTPHQHAVHPTSVVRPPAHGLASQVLTQCGDATGYIIGKVHLHPARTSPYQSCQCPGSSPTKPGRSPVGGSVAAVAPFSSNRHLSRLVLGAAGSHRAYHATAIPASSPGSKPLSPPPDASPRLLSRVPPSLEGRPRPHCLPARSVV